MIIPFDECCRITMEHPSDCYDIDVYYEVFEGHPIIHGVTKYGSFVDLYNAVSTEDMLEIRDTIIEDLEYDLIGC